MSNIDSIMNGEYHLEDWEKDMIKEVGNVMPDMTYTLKDAMKLCIDGTKVCHDELLNNGRKVKYIHFSVRAFFYVFMDGDSDTVYMETPNLPKSGWSIYYKEPVVYYKGFENVIDAVFNKKLKIATGAKGIGEYSITIWAEYEQLQVERNGIKQHELENYINNWKWCEVK